MAAERARRKAADVQKPKDGEGFAGTGLLRGGVGLPCPAPHRGHVVRE